MMALNTATVPTLPGKTADLGWTTDERKLQKPLLYAVDHEELWSLIRRFSTISAAAQQQLAFLKPDDLLIQAFSQQICHVRAYHGPLPAGLDLTTARFTPDKLRSNIERIYITIVRRRRTTALLPTAHCHPLTLVRLSA